MKRGSWIVRFKAQEGEPTTCTLPGPISLGNSCLDGNYINSIVCKMESSNANAAHRKGYDDVTDGKKTVKNDTVISDLLDSCSKDIDEHFFMVEEEVMSAIEEQTQNAKDNKIKTTAEINEEAEREIQKISERRDERLKQNESATEKRCRFIEERRHELLKQLHNLGEDLRASMEKLKTRHHGSSAAKVNANIDQLLTRFENNGEVEIPTSTDDRPPVDGLVGVAEQVSEIASGVSFTRVGGENIGKIDGERDRWVLEEEIPVAPIEVPVLKGSINEDEVVLEDIKTSCIYVTNIKQKTTRVVIKDKTHLFNCASKDGDVIVCGTRQGYVAVYDKSWKRIRTLSLPEKFLTGAEVMCVAVDENGMILVAQYGGSHIHVYHPSGSQYLKTLYMDDMVPVHGIHILPSGIAVHSAMYGEQVCLLDKDGASKATVYLQESEDRSLSILSANHGTDSLYNLFCDTTTGRCVVEELHDLSSGEVRVEKILDFPAPRIANGLIGAEGFSILKPDKIVTCDGNQLLIYGKRRGVEHLNDIVC